ncbi:proline-rich protein 2-like [Neopelma chrysocephalum]|uniref:proline-rich protein 2-like n=1 Tax=Neopelma chrysocephalum TaxID=114329 RepID=UPI000FCD1A1E|nr:proline-rich protein 2-like [Neopelma chrysocephalum]
MLPSASAPRQGGWETGDREASPPVGDLRQDFSLPAPSSPPGSAPPRALAPRPAAGSRPRPAAVLGPPPHPAPSPGAQERLPPASLAPLGFGPAASQTQKQQLPPPLHFQGEAVTTAAPAARPREEPVRDGTTQARTLRRPRRPLGHSVASRRKGSRSPATADPARPPLPGHWSAATALTSPHRRPPRQPPAGQRVPALELRFCRRLPLSPRRPQPHTPPSRKRRVPPAVGGDGPILPRFRCRGQATLAAESRGRPLGTERPHPRGPT